jgi:Membrane protein involved in the export of O-antigen and teichoic acid
VPKMNKHTGLSLKQNMLWNALGSTIYLGCQWLCTILAVRLSPDLNNAGLLALAMTTAAIFYCVAAFNMRSYQVSDSVPVYTDGIYSAARILLFAAALLSCVGFSFIQGYSNKQLLIVGLYMLFKISEALADVIGGAAQKRERMDIEGKSFALRGILGTAAFALTLSLTGDMAWAVAAMSLATYGVIFFYQYRGTRKICNIQPEFDLRQARKLIGACFLLFASSILYNSIVSVPRLFLQSYHGEDALAIYNAVATPAILVQTLCAYIYNPLLTRFTALYKQKEIKKLNGLVGKCLLTICAIVLVALATCFTLGEWGIRLLYGAHMAKHANLLYLMVINTGLTAAVWFFSSLAIVIRRIKGLIAASVLGMGCCCLFSVLLIPSLNMDGTSLAGMIAQALEILLLSCYFYFILKKEARDE